MYIFTVNIYILIYIIFLYIFEDHKENSQEKDGNDKHKSQDSGYVWSEAEGEKNYRELQKD